MTLFLFTNADKKREHLVRPGLIFEEDRDPTRGPVRPSYQDRAAIQVFQQSGVEGDRDQPDPIDEPYPGFDLAVATE